MIGALPFMFLCFLGIVAKADSSLPFSEALDFISNADAVYLHYVPPISDGPPSQAKDNKWEKVSGTTKEQLIDILSQKESYFTGSWGVSEGSAVGHIKICFQKGTDKLVLTCGSRKLDGIFNQKHITGLLNREPAKQILMIINAFVQNSKNE